MDEKKNKELPQAELSTPLSLAHQGRSAGILLHITSLPSPFGIGDLGPQAKAFADFLSRSGQGYWQLLPLNPTTASQGFSPYSASSSMAGFPLLISLELLVEDELLQKSDLSAYKITSSAKVNYSEVQEKKEAALAKAYNNFCSSSSVLKKDFEAFCKQEAYWLDDFALYSIVKKRHGNKGWRDWEDCFKKHDKKALQQFAANYKKELKEVKWQQMVFYRQWHQLKDYCCDLNIKLFGDLPFYVAYDSADVWAHQEIFSIDKNGNQVSVAGTPPDDFNKNGQLWGMPVFKWDMLEKRNFDWWICRLKKNLELFDLVRLDHFRAFAAYWEVKAGSENALNGKWTNAPGNAFFTALKKELGELPFIAEDLGHIDEPVLQLMKDFELPGMKVLQFAFDDDMPKSTYILHHHVPLSVAYSGTHDNNTTLGWFNSLPLKMKKNLSLYAGQRVNVKNVCSIINRMAYASVSKIAILQLQDVLGLDEPARMNNPAGGDNNWAWRMSNKHLTPDIEKQLRDWCTVYDRFSQ